ncbi:uncharacterized protein LOC105828159 [Monomorium pharaonis]|uniref:uncharacterized protein LOC105828159 n=1 Tax=Monomorium pharaonis TaxID=307658 RepID=UPI00063F7BCC|nr:uncharacterized protein LOC105828159 [Monomorium pharaonis]
MMKSICILAFIAVVAILPAAKSGITWNGGSRYGGDIYHGLMKDQSNVKYETRTDQKQVESVPRNESTVRPIWKPFLSAWGIIALIIGVIIFSTITYYAIILYPYLCKKERTYDIIGLTDVNSVCTDNANNVSHPLRVFCEPNNVSIDVSNNASLNR